MAPHSHDFFWPNTQNSSLQHDCMHCKNIAIFWLCSCRVQHCYYLYFDNEVLLFTGIYKIRKLSAFIKIHNVMKPIKLNIKYITKINSSPDINITLYIILFSTGCWLLFPCNESLYSLLKIAWPKTLAIRG